MATKTTDEIRLLIEGEALDLRKDIPYPLTLSIADLRDISKRKSSFSKTIQLPSTKNNNKILGNIYDLKIDIEENPVTNVNENFNPKKKAEFKLYHGSKLLLKGLMKILSIVKTGGKVTYEVSLFAELTNLMGTLGAKKLADLTMPELEHEYTKENITGSWDRTTDYVYPLIDYGVVKTKANAFTVNSLRPAVYAKFYIDKIFDEAGFTYESSFFDSQYFQDMIVPFNREGFDKQTSTSDRLIVSQSQENLFKSDEDIDFVNLNYITEYGRIFDLETEDTFDSWDTGSLAFTSSQEQRVDVTANVGFSLDYDIRLDTSGKIDDPDIFKKGYTASLSLTHLSSSGAVKNVYTDNTIVEDVTFSYLQRSIYTRETVGLNIFANISLEADDKLFVELDQGGSTFDVLGGNNYPTTGSVTSSIATGSTALSILGSSIEGGTLNQNVIVPPNLTQREFLLNILRVFNLLIIPDEDIPNHFKIVERDVYLESGKSLDWSEKLSIDDEVTIESLPNARNKSLIYTWKHDPEDYFLNIYRSKYNENYGEKEIDTGYEFSQQEKDVLELGLGTAVSVQYSNEKERGDTNIEIHTDSGSVVYVTSFAEVTNKFDGTVDTQDPDEDFPRFERAFIGRTVEILGQEYEIEDLISPWAFKVSGSIATGSFPGSTYDANVSVANVPFFYTGEQSKVIPAIYKSEDNGVTLEQYVTVPRLLRYSKNIPLVGETWTLQDTPVESTVLKASGYQSYTQTEYSYRTANNAIEISEYPFVSHVDDPKTPTEDLLFSKPQEFYFITSNYEPTFLYEDKHENITEDIIGTNNKLVTAKLDLTPLDILTFNFNDIIFINGTYYTVNTIKDYDPNSNLLTTVELVKKKLTTGT